MNEREKKKTTFSKYLYLINRVCCSLLRRDARFNYANIYNVNYTYTKIKETYKLHRLLRKIKIGKKLRA